MQDKVALATMAAAELGQGRAAARAASPSSGADPFEAMAPFTRADRRSSTRHTAPSDWLEGLVKAYVGDGLADDFYREIAAFLDPATRDLVSSSLDDDAATPPSSSTGCAPAIAADPALGGRLALWGRRLMGEALTQAQRVAAERDALTRCSPAASTAPASTWPRSAGCSPGSPSGTPSGWPSSASTPS